MGNSDKKETVESSYTKAVNEKNDRQVASHDETYKKSTSIGQPTMKDYSQKSTQSSFDSQQENNSRRNSICSEYFCWYGHEDCFSEGGKGRYSGGRSRKPRSRGNMYRPWRNNHRLRGRSHGPDGSRNSWGFGGSWENLSIEEIKRQHSKKKTEGAQELAKYIEEKSEVADKAAKIKEVLGSLSSSHIFSPQHQSQEYQQPQSSEPDGSRFVRCEEAVESGPQADALEDELFALPRNDSMEISDIIKQEVTDIKVISEIKHEQEFEFEPIDLNEKCEVGYGQDGDGTLDLDVMCVLGGENDQENAGQVDIVEVPKTPSPCIDLENIACEEATTSSLITASGSTDPTDSATRLAPVYKKRGRPSKSQARMIRGHEVVIGTVGDLVNVQENNRSEANIENHVEINLDNETSPDESMEQDNSNKMKSLGLIFEQESRLLSDLESVDCKMASLAHERSSVARQLLFLSELKSQMLK